VSAWSTGVRAIVARRNQHPTLLATVAAVGLLTGCGQLPGQDPIGSVAIIGINRTPTALSFEMVLPERTQTLTGSLDPGESGPIASFRGPIADGRADFDKDGCSKGVIIALDPSAREVARHPAGLCVGETWAIEPPPPTSSP
jgi:hypothetical protein